MDSSMIESAFEDGAASSDNFSPAVKITKAKIAPKKPAGVPKPKAAPKKLTQASLKPKAAAAKKRKPQSDEENSDVDVGSIDDDSLLSNTPPSAKRQKKAPQPKKSSGKPLQPIDNESYGLDGTDEPDSKPKVKAAKAGSATEQYQKLTQLEHILKRPDTYIGSVERTEIRMWIYNTETDSMESRDVAFVPGLYKIFDEILVNAADNRQRDMNMDEIKVTIDREKNEISVRNNGRGIPVEIHEKEGIYIPEMIFGHLLTSSNYDDQRDKVTGGRNGYGAKLCNVFSTEFILETADSRSGKKYKQTWTHNMSKMGSAKITPHKGDDYTKITFTPDLSKFGMDEMDKDFEGLVKRRVYDMAGTCKDVKIFLNGEKIKIRNFKKYMEMYTKAIKQEKPPMEDGQPLPADMQVILTDNPHERWEVGFAVSDGSFQQVSFVNSIATTSGGTHVNYIADQIVTKLLEVVKKKNPKGLQPKPAQIKRHLFIFVNCLIVNPAFTSQTKEQLTTKSSQFGSKCVLSDKFLKEIAKTEAVDNILHFAEKKADQVIKKTDGQRRTRMNNSKLTDANKAGTRDGHRCTLILTEGDSASLLALAGRAVVDPDLIGVFPLRGKLLNVRDASVDQITKNAEIQNIKKFMGLQHKKHYEDTKSLRYGHLMIMTDQDHDGSHIKGLLINFLEVSFPSLLKIPGFLKEFITPIVKVWKGDPKHPKRLQSFFTMPEYEAWKQTPGNERGWDHKYFKGLGTSSPSDAEVYFRDLDQHLKEFAIMQSEEKDLIDLAFSKKKADARKEWLRQFRPGTYLDMSTAEITYNDFVNKELILFSMADNQRSIPSVVDGFKPGQRKVLYTCFRRNLKKDVKVVELAGSVSGLTAYAYGETSLQQTIVGLAQTFVGSNNINCLEPSGNFGSRLQGGSDCASARYIYTRLSPFARRIFHATDEPLLTYNTDDGKTIEPEMYAPIVPMILINGADGIGTGWSSSIPNYSPEDVVENLKIRMEGSSKDDMKPMKPWFRSWQGETEDIGGDRYKFSGMIQQTGDNEIEITELPVRMWTQDFKDRLEEIIKAEKVPSFIKDYTEYNTPVKVHFIVKLEDKQMKVALEKGLEDAFKLSKTMATTNLVAFDGQGRITKYATVLDIMEEFYHIRMKFYEKRKRFMLNELEADLEKMSNQARFIKMIIDGSLIVNKKKKSTLVAELKAKDFKAIPKIVDARKEGEFEPVVEEQDEASDELKEAGANDYDYLLGMAIWSLTQERIDRLAKQIGDKEMEHLKLTNTSPKQLWITDLDEFLAEWRYQLEDEAKRAKQLAGLGRRTSQKLRIAGKSSKGAAKKRKIEDDIESDTSYTAAAKKPANGKAKQSSLVDYIQPVPRDPVPKVAAAKPSVKPLVNGVEQKPVARPPAEERGLLFDGASDPVSESDEKPESVEPVKRPVKAAAAAAAKAPAPRTIRVAKKPMVKSEDEDDDDDVFAEIAKEAKAKESKAPAGRQARTAARKPVKYVNNDSDISDDNGDDLLGEMSKMVKGISNGTGDVESLQGSKPLFSSTAPKLSNSSALAAKVKPSRTVIDFSDEEEDQTDYKNLIPKDSPQRQAARTARDVVLSDDEAGSFEIAVPKAALKTSATAKVKPVPVPKLKKTNGVSSSVVDALKAKIVPLSPAAKAYAAKQAKSKVAAAMPPPPQPKLVAKTVVPARKAKRVVESDEDDEDVDAIANDILDDDDEVESEMEIRPTATKTQVSAPTGRPARRTAASSAESKYTVDDDDDEDESKVSEADYDDEDESKVSEADYDDDDSD